MGAERQKAHAAAAALEYVESGMTLGLGSGSTAEIFLRLLGERVKEGLDVKGVPTSQRTAEVAREAVEMSVYEDFVVEQVKAGASIIGLYPCTKDEHAQAFAAWRKDKGR